MVVAEAPKRAVYLAHAPNSYMVADFAADVSVTVASFTVKCPELLHGRRLCSPANGTVGKQVQLTATSTVGV